MNFAGRPGKLPTNILPTSPISFGINVIGVNVGIDGIAGIPGIPGIDKLGAVGSVKLGTPREGIFGRPGICGMVGIDGIEGILPA